MYLYVQNGLGTDAWVVRTAGPSTFWWKLDAGDNALERGNNSYVYSLVAVHPGTGALVTNAVSLGGNTNADITWKTQWQCSSSTTNLNCAAWVQTAQDFRGLNLAARYQLVASFMILGAVFAVLAWQGWKGGIR